MVRDEILENRFDYVSVVMETCGDLQLAAFPTASVAELKGRAQTKPQPASMLRYFKHPFWIVLGPIVLSICL